MKLYGIRTCDTVKKARRFLDEAGVKYTFVDMDQTPVDETTLRRWLENVELKRLFNTRSTTYRTLGLKEKLRKDDDKIAWMVKENRLIKRPVLETDGEVYVGFNATEYQSLAQKDT